MIANNAHPIHHSTIIHTHLKARNTGTGISPAKATEQESGIGRGAGIGKRPGSRRLGIDQGTVIGNLTGSLHMELTGEPSWAIDQGAGIGY